MKKSEVAREALLAELDAKKTINEGCDNERKKRNNKKKKNVRKAKESKVLIAATCSVFSYCYVLYLISSK